MFCMQDILYVRADADGGRDRVRVADGGGYV